jgi:hypothetical protein
MDFFLENFNSLKMALLSFLFANALQTFINSTDVEGQRPLGLWHKEPPCN